MTTHDEFGYPLDTIAEGEFLAPVELPADSSDDLRARHADAYAAYQERVRTAHRARARYRRRHPRSGG